MKTCLSSELPNCAQRAQTATTSAPRMSERKNQRGPYIPKARPVSLSIKYLKKPQFLASVSLLCCTSLSATPSCQLMAITHQIFMMVLKIHLGSSRAGTDLKCFSDSENHLRAPCSCAWMGRAWKKLSLLLKASIERSEGIFKSNCVSSLFHRLGK